MIIAFTGAGISKASGIPTFTDQGDMRTKLDRYFSYKHPDEFKALIEQLEDTCSKAEPNDAHIALAEYEVPVITMNIDNLHNRAGTKHLLEIHGRLPNIVLYGDPAPLYSEAMEWITRLQPGDKLITVGTSFYTNISDRIYQTAQIYGAETILINNDAETEVRKALEQNKECIEPFETFIERELR